jgi:hypothetical protein
MQYIDVKEEEMSLVRKLKPDRTIGGVIIPISMIPIFGISVLIFGIQVGLYTLSGLILIFALFYLYVFFRTYNFTQLVIFADGAFASTMLLFLEPQYGVKIISRDEWIAVNLSGLVFFAVVILLLVITKRFKWRGREIFELAGESVEETGNGYTSRPRPVGKVEYTPEQIQDFARFCGRNLIGLPYYSTNNVTLVPIKMGEEFGRLLGLSGDYRDATWINFDRNGEVSVHISQKDYLDYRESLAFDPLCTALGQVFVEFLDLYTKGEGVRVIDRMNDLNIGVLS